MKLMAVKRPPVLKLSELASMQGVTKKRLMYLATLNPLPPVVLECGFAHKTHFYNRQLLLGWFNSTKLKRAKE